MVKRVLGGGFFCAIVITTLVITLDPENDVISGERIIGLFGLNFVVGCGLLLLFEALDVRRRR